MNSIRAFRDGKAKVFIGLGGNFVAAAPDTHVAEKAMSNAELTVQISTKLNRSHTVHGREALILPTLGRTGSPAPGRLTQRTTVEESVCAVHASQGPLEPASPPHLPLRDRHRLLDRRRDPGRPPRDPLGSVQVRLHRDPSAHRPRRSRMRGVRREGRPARRVRAAAPSA